MPRTIHLWGGRHDGGEYVIPYEYDRYACPDCGAVYYPDTASDIIQNRWRYHPFTSEQENAHDSRQERD